MRRIVPMIALLVAVCCSSQAGEAVEDVRYTTSNEDFISKVVSGVVYLREASASYDEKLADEVLGNEGHLRDLSDGDMQCVAFSQYAFARVSSWPTSGPVTCNGVVLEARPAPDGQEPGRVDVAAYCDDFKDGKCSPRGPRPPTSEPLYRYRYTEGKGVYLIMFSDHPDAAVHLRSSRGLLASRQ
jgi:hypothetical protein